MKLKNYTVTFILFIIILPEAFATAQMPDLLIYNGDTISIFANPLEQLYENDSIRPNFFGHKETCKTTACWRGYQAEWKIINNNLYLIGIYSCCYYRDKIKANLKDLFGDKFIEGKVRADWFTGIISAPKGKLLYYIHMGYESLYEKELEMEFINGKLISTKTYHNSKSRQSEYSQNDNKRKEFIYSHILWDSLPNLKDTIIRIFVQFSANENGIIDSAQIMKGYDPVFDREAIRVVKSIPNWDIYYRHGKHERKSWTQPIIFSNENREKYMKIQRALKQ